RTSGFSNSPVSHSLFSRFSVQTPANFDGVAFAAHTTINASAATTQLADILFIRSFPFEMRIQECGPRKAEIIAHSFRAVSGNVCASLRAAPRVAWRATANHGLPRRSYRI